MADLTTRPYEPDDAAELTALLNAIEERAGGRPAFTEDETRVLADTLIVDRATDSRMIFDGDGVLVAGGIVPTPPPGGFRVDIYGGVHPDRYGQGLGRELLTWQYQRAVEIHDERDPGSEWQAETGTLTGDTEASRLFPKLGFAPVRYFFDMVAPTTTAAEPIALPTGLRVVTPDTSQHHELYEAHMEAFADHWGYQRREFEPWTTLTVNSTDYRPELSRVALAGDEVAGYVLSYTDASPDRLYIGQVGTRRAWRRQGLASALLSEVLAAAGAAGLALAGLGVDADSPTGAVGLYERAGFTREHSFVAYRRPIPPRSH